MSRSTQRCKGAMSTVTYGYIVRYKLGEGEDDEMKNLDKIFNIFFLSSFLLS